jgi:hypothetical protein
VSSKREAKNPCGGKYSLRTDRLGLNVMLLFNADDVN